MFLNLKFADSPTNWYRAVFMNYCDKGCISQVKAFATFTPIQDCIFDTRNPHFGRNV